MGINLMIAGFFFWGKFGIALIPFMLILFSIWSALTGVLIKNRIFLISGIVINILAYCSFFIGKDYHPLILSIVSLIGIVVPGIILNYSSKKSNV
jgi:polysaccharide pyruvyl transferase WcaK-like protein